MAVFNGKMRIENEKNPKKNKKTAMVVASVLCVAIVFVVLLTYVLPHNDEYNEAISLMESGNNDEAYIIFKSLGNYRKSNDFCNQMDFVKAKEFLSVGNIRDAYLSLSSITDYEDGAQLKEELEEKHPHLSILLAKSGYGKTVTFGEYEQDNDFTNGKEPIEWIILDNQDGNIYMLSKYVLDAQAFNIKETNDCSLDDWLNEIFCNTAFNEDEKNAIGHVSLLHESDIDANTYGENYLSTDFTIYANSLINGDYDRRYWWIHNDSLRYDTYRSGHLITVMPLSSDSKQRAHYTTVICGVRPTITLFVNEDIFPSEPDYRSIEAEVISTAPASFDYEGGNLCSWCGGDGRTHDWVDEGNSCTHCDGDGWIESGDY